MTPKMARIFLKDFTPHPGPFAVAVRATTPMKKQLIYRHNNSGIYMILPLPTNLCLTLPAFLNKFDSWAIT
jgi:hypothetical protein